MMNPMQLVFKMLEPLPIVNIQGVCRFDENTLAIGLVKLMS